MESEAGNNAGLVFLGYTTRPCGGTVAALRHGSDTLSVKSYKDVLLITTFTLVVLGRNNPSLYTVNGRPLYVHLNGLAIVLLK